MWFFVISILTTTASSQYFQPGQSVKYIQLNLNDNINRVGLNRQGWLQTLFNTIRPSLIPPGSQECPTIYGEKPLLSAQQLQSAYPLPPKIPSSQTSLGNQIHLHGTGYGVSGNVMEGGVYVGDPALARASRYGLFSEFPFYQQPNLFQLLLQPSPKNDLSVNGNFLGTLNDVTHHTNLYSAAPYGHVMYPGNIWDSKPIGNWNEPAPPAPEYSFFNLWPLLAQILQKPANQYKPGSLIQISEGNKPDGQNQVGQAYHQTSDLINNNGGIQINGNAVAGINSLLPLVTSGREVEQISNNNEASVGNGIAVNGNLIGSIINSRTPAIRFPIWQRTMG